MGVKGDNLFLENEESVKAKKLLTKDNYDADLLKQALIGQTIDGSIYGKEQSQAIVKAVEKLAEQFKDNPEEFKQIQQDISSGNNNAVVKAIEKLAKYQSLQTIVTSVASATMSKSSGKK